MTNLVPRDLRRKQDAVVVRAESLDTTRRMAALGTDLETSSSRWKMVADLQRRERSRELRVVAGPRWNPEMARWEARVVRNKPPAPAWRRPLLIGLSVAAPLLAFMAAAIWVLFSLSATAVVALCGFALLALFGVVKHHARTITMEQKVTIR